MLNRVVVTGVGVVAPGLVGGGDTLDRFLSTPPPAPDELVVDDAAIGSWLGGADPRRLSRVSRLTLAAARLALADAGLDDAGSSGLILGTEHGDLCSTIEFVEGFLRAGATGLSPLLFPNTVMNVMAATATIAVGARAASLTLNVRAVGGELALARAAHTVGAGRLEVALAGGVDVRHPTVESALAELGAGEETRGEGATVLVLESPEHARRRGARSRGEILGAAWRGLRARPNGVGRRTESRAIGEALARAGLHPDAIGWVYGSASGDRARGRWESALLADALGPRAALASLSPWFGQHAGLGALHVAAALQTARSGRLAGPSIEVPRGPGLVHGIARGGTHVALVVGGPRD